MFFDSHAHLTSKDVLPDVDQLVHTALAAGVNRIINICIDEASLLEGIKLQKRFVGHIYNTAATTPHDVDTEGETFFPLVMEAAEKQQLIALGETGLDYHYEHSPKAVQQDFLNRYFALALEHSLPLIFHCREAFSDLFSMADDAYDGPAVLHCFTGTLEEAKEVLNRGWYISISGIITFKKSESLRQIVKYLPLDRILIETDTPYLAPQSRRGKMNEPAFIVETCEMVASLKELDLATVARQTTKNGADFFSLNSDSI